MTRDSSIYSPLSSARDAGRSTSCYTTHNHAWNATQTYCVRRQDTAAPINDDNECLNKRLARDTWQFITGHYSQISPDKIYKCRYRRRSDNKEDGWCRAKSQFVMRTQNDERGPSTCLIQILISTN